MAVLIKTRILNKKSKADSVQLGYINTFYQYVERHRGGGGNTPLQAANRDVPLDGVTFSRLE